MTYTERIEDVNTRVLDSKVSLDDAFQEIGFLSSDSTDSWQNMADYIRQALILPNNLFYFEYDFGEATSRQDILDNGFTISNNLQDSEISFGEVVEGVTCMRLSSGKYRPFIQQNFGPQLYGKNVIGYVDILVDENNPDANTYLSFGPNNANTSVRIIVNRANYGVWRTYTYTLQSFRTQNFCFGFNNISNVSNNATIYVGKFIVEEQE